MNVSKVLAIETLSSLISRHFVEKASLHYTDFVYQITKQLVSFLLNPIESVVLFLESLEMISFLPPKNRSKSSAIIWTIS